MASNRVTYILAQNNTNAVTSNFIFGYTWLNVDNILDN